MATSSDEHPQQKRRRLNKNKDTSKCSIVKAKSKGEGYEKCKNKFLPPKSIPKEDSCKCPRKCHFKIDEEARNQIWSYFYSLENKDAQDTYLQTLIELREVKRRRSKPKEISSDAPSMYKRNITFAYNLIVKGDVIDVCRNIFIEAHGITRSRVMRLSTLLLQNKQPVDMRGKTRVKYVLPEAISAKVHEHISRFEVKEVLVGGETKKYLDARLNISKMYNMFVRLHPELQEEVKYYIYNMHLKENFIYSFGYPQVEVCKHCENFNKKLQNPCLSDYVKGLVLSEQVLHKKTANKFDDVLKAAEKNKDDNVVVLSFDFMQSLPLPNIPEEELFYMRQLWLNAFCIYDVKAKKARMYLYHEGDGKKTSNEVCSLLLHYIEMELPRKVRHLLLFSDESSSHNKNHTVVRFLMNLCDRGRFDSVVHHFPERGHTSLPCESEFGAIKNALKKVNRIFTPEQYGNLILKICKNASVDYVHAEEIFDFNTWWQESYEEMAAPEETSTSGISDENENHFKLLPCKQLEFRKNNPGKVIAKTLIDGEDFSTFTLSKCTNVPELPTAKAYPLGKVPMCKKKLEDLKRLILYAEGFKNFYEQFLEWPVTDDESCVEEVYSDIE